jgi:hypothetical protein
VNDPQDIERFRVKPRKLAWRDLWQVLPGNLVPLLGVLLFGWDGWEVVLFYYLETAVIGLFHALKLASSQPGSQRNLGGQETPMSPAFATILFVGNYGAFTAIQLYMIWDQIVFPPLAGTEGASFWISVAVLVANHAWQTVGQFFLPGKHRTTRVDALFLEPYSRIFVQQAFAIIGGLLLAFAGNGGLAAVAAFILVKTAVELYVATFWEALLREAGRRRAKKSDG